MLIPFNKPYLPLSSIRYMIQAALSGTIAGDGKYTALCHRFFEEQFGFRKVLLTTSCTDALEMAAILTDIRPGDEVILPSFTFMSTANAFLLRGARLVFCDTLADVPNIDPDGIEALITPRTRVLVVVHYSGLACEMDRIMAIASKHNLLVVEDAAHAMEAYYKDEPLGSIGHLGAFSFHETKNIIAGEGGMLAINHEPFLERAEIIWEKGTDRAAFHRGEVEAYTWLDIGSSFLPSDGMAAFLYAQIKRFRKIQRQRKWIWWEYHERLAFLEEQGCLCRPVIPRDATVNGNMFYITLSDRLQRDTLLDHLNLNGIQAVFHYFPLHASPYFKEKHDGRELPNTRRFSDTLLRLPFYYSMGKREIAYIVEKIREFFTSTPAASPVEPEPPAFRPRFPEPVAQPRRSL
ncbi:MAG: dTDP-4-amino-4,6-dideoxygalactose transaminase [Bacteroidetes bacterium]|nr:MAG: dTDP-4-amino-4,6-dideoxygalactose transaminase [Bacteroidota bacterium]